eukprot:5675555-Amphidinium_carterae.1
MELELVEAHLTSVHSSEPVTVTKVASLEQRPCQLLLLQLDLRVELLAQTQHFHSLVELSRTVHVTSSTVTPPLPLFLFLVPAAVEL